MPDVASLLAAGLIAGVAVGAVLRRADFCFHAMFRSAWNRDTDLLATWALAVGVGAVGLTLVFELGIGDGLNRGLPFDPVRNIVGGLVIGVGMVVARSCTSGLFYKLGSGMAAALAGLVGWALGELAVRDLDPPGEAVLDAGDDATFAGVLGLPRGVLAVGLLVVVVGWVWRRTPCGTATWSPWLAGLALGVALVGAWALAGWAGASFGPSTVGAVSGVADRVEEGRDLPWWLLAFLGGIVAGAFALSVARGGFRIRWESAARTAQLGVGGVLLGAGGRIAGGCNLGHGLSGVSQLGVSSWVVVASMAVGVGAAGAVSASLGLGARAWRADPADRSPV